MSLISIGAAAKRLNIDTSEAKRFVRLGLMIPTKTEGKHLRFDTDHVDNTDPLELANYLSCPEAADYCGVSQQTIRRWVKADTVKSVTIGRREFLKRSDLPSQSSTTRKCISLGMNPDDVDLIEGIRTAIKYGDPGLRCIVDYVSPSQYKTDNETICKIVRMLVLERFDECLLNI